MLDLTAIPLLKVGPNIGAMEAEWQWVEQMNRGVGNQCVSPCGSELVIKIKGALFTGFGGRSNLAIAYGTSDFGTLEVSSDHLSVASWSSPRYEVRKELIEQLIFREHRILRFARLRILHKLPRAPEYILFVSFNPTELKAALTNAGYALEPVSAREQRD